MSSRRRGESFRKYKNSVFQKENTDPRRDTVIPKRVFRASDLIFFPSNTFSRARQQQITHSAATALYQTQSSGGARDDKSGALDDEFIDLRSSITPSSDHPISPFLTLLLLILCSTSTLAADRSLQQIVSSVDSRYNHLTTLEANFQQSYSGRGELRHAMSKKWPYIDAGPFSSTSFHHALSLVATPT